MSVEGIADLRPQGVSRSEATGADAYGGPGGEGLLPEGFQQGVRSHHLESIFAGVTGAGHPESLTGPVPPPDLILLECRGRDSGGTAERRSVEQGVNELGHPGPLNGNGAGGVRGVFHAHVSSIRESLPTGLQPGDVGVDATGIDDEQVGFFGDPVGVQVIDGATGFQTQVGVLAEADGQFPKIVGEQPIEERQGLGSLEPDLAHVADIEDSGRAAHRMVLLDDRGVLDGHFPASELDELAAELLVRCEEGGAFQRHGWDESCGGGNRRHRTTQKDGDDALSTDSNDDPETYQIQPRVFGPRASRDPQATTDRTTSPATSVRRKLRPLLKKVSRSWSSPIRCRMVAWRSLTLTLSTSALWPKGSVAP